MDKDLGERNVTTDPISIDDSNKSKNGEDTAPTSVQMSSLRSAIDAKLHEEGVYNQIRQLVHEKVEERRQKQQTTKSENVNDDNAIQDDGEGEAQQIEEEDIIHEVLQSDIVQQLLAAVKPLDYATSATKPGTIIDTFGEEEGCDSSRSGNEIFLYLRLAGGKAFVDQLIADEETDIGQPFSIRHVGQVASFFRVILTFQNQRIVSKDVRCCVDPPFDEHFRFRIERKKSRTNRTKRGAAYDIEIVSPWEALYLVDEPVQIDLLNCTKKLVEWDPITGAVWHELTSELVSVHRLDWRRVLCSTLQLVHFPIQLLGKMKVPIGTLDFRADILNFKRTPSIAREATLFLQKETLQRNTLNRSFYNYAKQWWEEYRSETKYLDQQQQNSQDGEDEYSTLLSQVSRRPRLVKLFGEDDEGRFRMVCKFLVPLLVPEAVKSPREAARFVGLLPYESDLLIGGVKDETWRSLAAFLSSAKGSAQDHALLLASLLLGCGLDAYVCIGTISSNKADARLFGSKVNTSVLQKSGTKIEVGHVWVMTKGTNPDDSKAITFWESTTGEIYPIANSKGHNRHGYCSIDCVFNHRQLYANIQSRAYKLAMTSFDFDNDSAWKRMDDQLIADLPFAQPHVPLQAPDVAAAPGREKRWTTTLRKEISSRRRSNGLITRWSDELSFYLLPALNSYEMERLYGTPQIDNDFFQQSITRYVPDGHTFQGVPVMLTRESPQEAMGTLLNNNLVAEMVELHARGAQFGLAVRCFAYPENIFVMWVMLAVSYQSLT